MSVVTLPNQFDCGAASISSIYRDPQYLQDLLNSLGLTGSTISKYCDSMQSVGGQFMLLNANNDPLHLAHLYRDFLVETPTVFLVDNKPELVQAILDYVENLILTGEGLTPQRASILNGILPAQYSQGYDRINHKLEFPRDHHIKTNVSAGWYFLVGNVLSVKDKQKMGLELIFWYYPIFPRDFLKSRSLPDDAFLLQSVTVALTVIQGSSKSFFSNATGLVMTNSGAAKHSLPEGKKVFFSVGNSSLLSDSNDLSNLTVVARDVDTQTGAPLLMYLKLKAVKPLFYQGNGKGCTPCTAGLGTLYYSYPRYKIEDIQLQYGTLSAPMTAKDFDLPNSSFWLDHQWVYGFFAAAFPENVMVRALSNFYNSSFSGWYWFMGHLYDGRDFTFSRYCDSHMDSLPAGDVVMTDKTEAKVISPVGVASKIFTDNKIVAKSWISVQLGSVGGSNVIVTAFVPTECVLTIDGEEFSMKADYPAPITKNRQGAYVREGSVTIHNSAGTVIGHGFMEMTGWFISQKDEDSSIYTLLGGALLDNRRHIADLSRRNPNWGLKLQSILFLILIAIVIFLIFVLLPLYIIYVLVMAYKQQPTQDFSQLPPKP